MSESYDVYEIMSSYFMDISVRGVRLRSIADMRPMQCVVARLGDSKNTEEYMWGMFAKPDLSLPERSALMLTIVQASLMAYVKHGTWLSEDHRATVIGNWLERNGRKAGIMFRGKVSAAADEMARYLVATCEPEDVRDMYLLLDRAQYLKAGEEPETMRQVYTLMKECERAVIAKGLAS